MAAIPVAGGASQDEVYRSDTLRVVRNLTDPTRFEAKGCDLVTFEPVAVNQGRLRFGEEFAAKYRLNALHIIPTGNDWYQYDDLPDCLAAAARQTAQGVTLYGSSMGGFAATTYADAFPGCRVIALSPQFSIRRDLVPFEKRWAEDAARIRFLPGDDRVATECPMHILFDPKNPDAEHARLIAGRGKATLIEVAGGGHPVGPVLAEAGCLSSLILAIMRGEWDARSWQRILRERLPGSPTHHFVLAGQAAPVERLRHIRAGLERDPHHTKLRFAYAAQLAANGAVVEAMPHFEYALRRRPLNAAYRRTYLRVCGKAGLQPTATISSESA